MPSLFKKRKATGKSFPVKISTMDAELEFSLNWKARGHVLAHFNTHISIIHCTVRAPTKFPIL